MSDDNRFIAQSPAKQEPTLITNGNDDFYG